MEKKIAKKLLIKTIIVAILILIIMWFLGNIFQSLTEQKNLVGIILIGIIGALLTVGLIACYQFAKEYIHTIRKKNN
ncbi:MAG: hypothetical protein JSW60_07720 [Thermoplasmatales archaeon]|nr:MAG: hypothetical protein JSW60_07720 [Thermoplasmatales archaeon]